MWPNKSIPVMKKQHLETESIEQQLKKVTKSNWCLICENKLIDEAAARNHFLNVHHKGVFACKMLGCNYIANTNGDLRMHHLLWHSDVPSQNCQLPLNIKMLSSVPSPKNAETAKENRVLAPKTKYSSGTTKNKIIGTMNSRGISPKCTTCAMTFSTFLGINMHQPYHRFGSFLRKLKKMSDIKTIDEMKTILDINGVDNLERKRQQSSPTNTLEPSSENALESMEETDKQNQSTNGTEEPIKSESSQSDQQNIELVEIVDDNSMVIKIPNMKRKRRKRPTTPVASIVSISSESETSNDEVDIEF